MMKKVTSENGHESAFSSKCVMSSIGKTPLVRLKAFSKTVNSNVFAKLEFANPTLSAKDRIAAFIVEKAIEAGEITPGGTFKCLLTVADKASKEKINSLKSLGAEVILCPAAVPPEHPDSYYQQAISASQRIENSYYVDQNFNPNNAQAHFEGTGPEIWEQSKHLVTHLFAAVGTGGTISGTSRFLKSRNENINVIGVDAYGSVLKKYHETGIYDISCAHPYKMEGVGKSIIPGNVNFDVIDQFVKVGDLKSALKARKLAKEEGIWAGHSSGAVLQAVYNMKDQLTPSDNVVIIFSDHGSKYLSTIYNDEWVEEKLYSKV